MSESTKNTINFSITVSIPLYNNMVRCMKNHNITNRSAFLASAARDKIKTLDAIDINHVAENISEVDKRKLIKLLTQKKGS